MNLRAARTSAALAILFLVVYGGTNWLASIRARVGSVHFQWEHRIPFVPLYIVPYMSIDLFFLAAPFICRDDRERSTLARRIAAAILIAGAFFLLWPLRFAFERPPASGWLGVVFNAFRELDQPFNQFPSLHIALCAILADTYCRRFTGPLRVLLVAWFLLIAASPLLTWQHHIIDIFGGAALGLFCLHFFDVQSLRQPFLPNRRVGTYYLAGAAGLALLSLAARPWSLFLLWPAGALLLTCAAYFWLGPGIYRKRDGAFPLTTWLLLWPVLIGQQLSRAHYARTCSRHAKLTDNLWIGRSLTGPESCEARDAGIVAVLDLTAELAEPKSFRALAYRSLPVLDLTAPTPSQIQSGIDFIREHSARGIVYVHCKIGFSRTAVVAGAYLLSVGLAETPEHAIDMLRAARPGIIIRPEARQALHDFARELRPFSPRSRPAPPAAVEVP